MEEIEQPVAGLGPKGWDICGIVESQCDNTFYFPCKNQIFVRSFDTPTDLSSSSELSFFPSYVLFTFLNLPIVQQHPHSFSRAGVGHAEVYQQN